MKKLQNNFTNPEQSKRLLKLGVPADSADCYHDLSLNRRGMLSINGIYSLDVPYNHLFSNGTHRYLPCWSVGRLMEIIGTCAIFPPHGSSIFMHDESDYIGHLVRTLEKHIEWFDFSKLEE